MQTMATTEALIDGTGRQLYEIVRQAVSDGLRAAAFDLELGLQQQAMRETVEFVMNELPLHLGHRSRQSLLEKALGQAPAEGLILEFGVYKGRSINFIASRVPGRMVYGFDSFEGSPEPWLYRRQAFHDVGGPPPVRDNCELVTGWFHETLPPFLERMPGPCAFVHTDCDIYSSTSLVLQQLEPRLVPGTVILFDEFFNYPGWKNGEYRAFRELIERTGFRFEYLGFTYKPVAPEQREREGGTPFQVAVQLHA